MGWQKNKGVHPKASKSQLKVDRPDPSNYFNHKNDGVKNVSCCAATSCKLLNSPGIADMYTFFMNTWNTLPESYQQIVYKSTFATVPHHVQHAGNTTPAIVISVEAAHVDNTILLDYLSSEVALEEPEIGSTDPNIPIDNNCTDDELQFGMPGGSGDYEYIGDESDERDAIPTASQQLPVATHLKRFDVGISDLNRYESEDGDDVHVDEED